MDTITTIQSLLMCSGSARPVTVVLTPNEESLIAAAPDMLEALQDAMAIIETPVSQTPKNLLKRVAAIRAAIAKAEGRS